MSSNAAELTHAFLMQPLSETEPLLCYLQCKSIYLLIFLIIIDRKRILIGNDFTRLTLYFDHLSLKKPSSPTVFLVRALLTDLVERRLCFC